MSELNDIPTSLYKQTSGDLLNQLGYAETAVISEFYQGILKDLDRLQNLATNKGRVERTIGHLSNGLEALAKIGNHDLNIKWLGIHGSSKWLGIDGSSPIRQNVPGHEKFKALLKSGITNNPEYELVTHQIATITFYGGLCSLLTYLNKFKSVFNEKEKEAMRLLSTRTQTIHKELPNYLSQKPNNHLEIEDMAKKFNNILYKPSSCDYGEILQSYFQYYGDIFSDLSCMQSDSVSAFNSIYGYEEFIKKDGPVKIIDSIINLGESNVVVPPLDLYFNCVQSFLQHRLDQPDMQSVEKDRKDTIALYGEMRGWTRPVLLEKATEYLAKHK